LSPLKPSRKKDVITKERIIARREELVKALEQHKTTVIALGGAIQCCDELLAFDNEGASK
jgi:hypothetical protein